MLKIMFIMTGLGSLLLLSCILSAKPPLIMLSSIQSPMGWMLLSASKHA